MRNRHHGNVLRKPQRVSLTREMKNFVEDKAWLLANYVPRGFQQRTFRCCLVQEKKRRRRLGLPLPSQNVTVIETDVLEGTMCVRTVGAGMSVRAPRTEKRCMGSASHCIISASCVC